MTDDDRLCGTLAGAVLYCAGWLLLAAIWIVRRYTGMKDAGEQVPGGNLRRVRFPLTSLGCSG